MQKSLVLEVLLVTFLFLFSVYMWSLPIKNNPLPYGEVDAAHHFGITDYMNEKDFVSDEFYKPNFLYYAYSYRSILGPGKISTKSPYTPNFFINEAIAQIFGGDRFVSYYLFLSISCVSIVISSYFLIRKIFGIIPAFLTGLLISASKIDIMSFVMGQYIILISFACLPLILYCYYLYTNSIIERKNKPIYLYVMALLIATQYFNHFQSLVDTFVILLIFTVVLLIKERKIPFNIKHAIVAVIIFLVIMGPFLFNSILSTRNMYSVSDNIGSNKEWSGLFQWYTQGYSAIAVGQDIFSYKEMHGYWTLPLLFGGIIFLLIRRKNKDLLMLSWLVAIYLILHFDLLLGWDNARLFRSVNDVPYIFYPIIAIGVAQIINFANFIKMSVNLKKCLSGILIIVFILVFINFNLKSSFEMLDKSYTYPYRINPSQYEAALWIKENIPENAFILDKGTLVQKTARFIRSISHVYMFESDDHQDFQRSLHPNESIELGYYFIDYSELVMFGMKKEADALLQWEISNLGNLTPIYNKNNIRIYNVRT